MNFGLVEALEKALAPATRQLHELLEGITEQQRQTNELLTELLQQGRKPTPRAKP